MGGLWPVRMPVRACLCITGCCMEATLPCMRMQHACMRYKPLAQKFLQAIPSHLVRHDVWVPQLGQHFALRHGGGLRGGGLIKWDALDHIEHAILLVACLQGHKHVIENGCRWPFPCRCCYGCRVAAALLQARCIQLVRTVKTCPYEPLPSFLTSL